VLGGDLINLKIIPEVSSLDFNNAVVIIEGFRILRCRRARRHRSGAARRADLRDCRPDEQHALSSMRKVPGLGDIPILGHSSRAARIRRISPSWS
jgi:Flp pilus assembly secretin CpaC